jgi:hypothetical protein
MPRNLLFQRLRAIPQFLTHLLPNRIRRFVSQHHIKPGELHLAPAAVQHCTGGATWKRNPTVIMQPVRPIVKGFLKKMSCCRAKKFAYILYRHTSSWNEWPNTPVYPPSTFRNTCPATVARLRLFAACAYRIYRRSTVNCCAVNHQIVQPPSTWSVCPVM